MRFLTLLALLVCFGLEAGSASAEHPGHGEKKMLAGTIVAVEPTRVQIEHFDQASFSNQRVWVLLDDKTTIRAGKERQSRSDLRSGQSIECAAETDEGPDGASLLLAITVRIKPGK